MKAEKLLQIAKEIVSVYGDCQEVAVSMWSVYDVIQQATANGINLSLDDATNIVIDIQDDYDCDIAVSVDHVENKIRRMCEE